jgi:hypothetical protein
MRIMSPLLTVAMVKVAAFANAAIPTTEANPKTSDLMFIGFLPIEQLLYY